MAGLGRKVSPYVMKRLNIIKICISKNISPKFISPEYELIWNSSLLQNKYNIGFRI